MMDEDERESFLKDKKTIDEKKGKKRTKKDGEHNESKSHKKRKQDRKQDDRKKGNENKDKETMDRMKREMEEMKKKLDELTKFTEPKEKEKHKIEVEERKSALGYDEKTYLSMGFINWAIWITNTIATKMTEKMEENVERWEPFKKMHTSSIVGTPCATFNRGEPCHLGKWHTASRKRNVKQRLNNPFPSRQINPSIQSSNEELRIHACTLCLKSLGVMSGHSVVNCPWILEKNWTTSAPGTCNSDS